MKIHPHHDLIIAYLEDKELQYQSLDQWVDIPRLSVMGYVLPQFNHNVIYRLKPIVKPNRMFRLKAKEIGRDIVVRDPEHWEQSNVEFEFEGNTGKLISVKVIGE